MESVILEQIDDDILARSMLGFSENIALMESFQVLKVQVKNETLADTLRKTPYTIEELVIDESFESFLCALFFTEHNTSMIDLAKVLQGEKVVTDYCFLKDGYFSILYFEDAGLCVKHYVSSSYSKRIWDSGYESVSYTHKIDIKKEPFPLTPYQNFSTKFIINK